MILCNTIGKHQFQTVEANLILENTETKLLSSMFVIELHGSEFTPGNSVFIHKAQKEVS